MQCVTPMFRRYEIGKYKEGKIVSREEVMQGLELNPNNIRFSLNKMNHVGAKIRYEQIPCGKCWACRLNYSAQWATRLTYECQKSEHNYFITLTYDDNSLPIAEKIDYEGITYYNEGKKQQNEGCLVVEHMNKFIHDLRQEFRRNKKHTGIKYFYCGEYGEETHRPHYHIILLNCPLDLSKFYDTHIDERYKEHWKSTEIEHFWKYGMIDIANAEWSSCAYVARYCLKKIHQKNNEEYYKECKIPEFVRMSKGIGKEYYKKHKKDIYKNDEIIMRTVKGNISNFKPPKAWDKLFKEEFPEEWEKIHKNRVKCAERSRKLNYTKTDLTDAEKLQMEYEKLQVKTNQLPRNLEPV